MVNHATNKAVDVLDSRDVETVSEWLKNFKNLKIVTRDGSQAYKSAITKANPEIIQVADRFHLEKNVSEAIVSELKTKLPEKITINKNTEKVEKEVKQKEKLKSDVSRENYDRKNKVFIEVKQKYKQGYTISKIAKEMNLNRHTVSKYIGLEELPATVRHQTVDLDKYKKKILDNIFLSAKEIYNMLKENGYKKSYASVARYIKKLKEHSKAMPENNQNNQSDFIEKKYIIKLVYNKGISDLPVESKLIKEFLKQEKKTKEIIDLMTNFRIVLFSKSEEKLKEWLEKAQKINIKKLNSVINGIKQDYQTVVNCIDMLDYSNGTIEGKNNKIKYIKRSMFGRCKFSLLRKKILFCC